MKRTWMFMGIFVMLVASIPIQGWAQEEVKVFTRGTETITVTEITPDSLYAGVGKTLVVDSVIYAGTADYLWISKDTGKTWVKRDESHGLTISRRWIQSLAAIDSGHILASGENGVFRSTDGGDTWVHIFWAPPYGAVLNLLVADNGTIFGGGDYLYRSTNNGNAWEMVADSTLTYPYVWRMAQTADGTILAGINSGNPPSARGVLRSTDNGDSWFLVDSGFVGYKGVQGIAASPNGTKHAYAALYLNGAWQSEDDGLSWERVEGIPILHGKAATVCSSLGAFFGFDTRGSSDHALWRSYPTGWEAVPGFQGLAVEGITTFDEKTVVVCGTGRIFLVKFDVTTGVEEVNNVPSSFALAQNYPNPFNPTTTIEFTLPNRSHVRLTVYNLLGEEVATLVDEDVPAGTRKTTWDAAGLPSGIYFARLEVKNFTAVKRMVFIK